MTTEATDPVSPKTSEEALEFVRNMQKAFPKTPRTKKELAALRKYLAQFTDAELRAVGRRVLSDLMQRPSRTIHEGDLPPWPPSKPETHVATPPTRGQSVETKTEKGTKPRVGRPRKRIIAVAKPRRARRRGRRS
jgi:hypothetical protein